MNAERLLALYDRVAEAPDAVVRLRRFVLDLAVRGKLVEQAPADEPAAELLKRIAAEKARLKIRHHVKPLATDEVPFCLPTGWLWSRIGGICTKTGSGSTPRGGKNVYKQVGISFLRSQNVYDDGLRLDGVACIELDVHARMAGTAVQARDLLLNITGGSMGRCCRVPDDFAEANVSQHVAIMRPAVSEMSDFLHKLVLSPYFQAFIFDEQTGAGRGGLPKNKMDRIAVALPPLSEQRRIVAKVHELMALCDRLEETRNEREETRDRLTIASLARLSAPDTDDGAFRAHARFAVDALPALTARADQVEQLRQTILNLAVRGKLVEQDPADESAADLLNRISAEITRLKIQREVKPLATDEVPFCLPEGWLWSRIGEICTKTGSGSTPRGGKNVYKEVGVPFLRSQNVYDDGLQLDGVACIEPGVHARMSGTAVRARDLLLNITGGSMGRCCRVPDDFAKANVSQHVTILRPAVSEMADFLHKLVLSPYFQAFIFDEQTGAGRGGLPKNKMDRIAVALPPLSEQRRIVAKVDEMMALCDRLETSLGIADTRRNRLLKSLIRDALMPRGTRALSAAFALGITDQ